MQLSHLPLAGGCHCMSGSNHTVSEPRAFNAWLYSFQFFVRYLRVDQLDSLMLIAYYRSRLDLCNKALRITFLASKSAQLLRGI